MTRYFFACCRESNTSKYTVAGNLSLHPCRAFVDLHLLSVEFCTSFFRLLRVLLCLPPRTFTLYVHSRYRKRGKTVSTSTLLQVRQVRRLREHDVNQKRNGQQAAPALQAVPGEVRGTIGVAALFWCLKIT